MPHNKKYEEQALLYAYGELEDSKEDAFVEHLRECKECQSILKMTALTSAALPPMQAPVLNLQEEPAKAWSFKDLFNRIKNLSRPILWGTAAACCVAVMVGGFGLRQSNSNGYMYFSDSIYAQIGDVETDIDSLLEDINSYLYGEIV